MNIEKNKALFYDSFSVFLQIGNNKSNSLTGKDITSDQALTLFIRYADFCSDTPLSTSDKNKLFIEYFKDICPDKKLSFEDYQKINFKIKEFDKNNNSTFSRHPDSSELFTELLRINLSEKEFENYGHRLNVFDVIRTELNMRKRYNIEGTKKFSSYTREFIEKNFISSRISGKKEKTIKKISERYNSKYNYASPKYIMSRLKKGFKRGLAIFGASTAIFTGVTVGVSTVNYIKTTNDINNYSYSQAISDGITLEDMGLSNETQKEFNDLNQMLELYQNKVPTDEEMQELIKKTENLHEHVLFDKVKKTFDEYYPNSKLISISDPIAIHSTSDNKDTINGYYIKLHKVSTNSEKPISDAPDVLYLSNNMFWNINASDIGYLGKNLSNDSKQVDNAITNSDTEYNKIDTYKNVVHSLNDDMEKLKKFIAMDYKIENECIWDPLYFSSYDSQKITPKVPDHPNKDETDFDKE